MMANRKKTRSDDDRPGLDIQPSKLPAATGTEDVNLQLRLVTQVMESLWLPESTPEATRLSAGQAALAALEGIKPSDEVEGLLAAQMVATHAAAMECLRRAMIPGQTFEGRDNNLKHATKLLGMYARQLEALDKHRGKGQQKITVERVNVNSGGQAIVGNVGTAADKGVESIDPPALENNSTPPMSPVDGKSVRKPKQRVKRKTRTKDGQ